MKWFTCAVLTLTLTFGPVFAADEISVEDFVAFPKYRNLQISPDGRHLAVIAPVEGVNHLVFLDITDIDNPVRVGLLPAPRDAEIASAMWVNDERVIYQISIIQGALEIPRSTGQLFATNYDGSKRKELWSIQKNGTFASVIDTIDDDDNYVVISHQGRTRKQPFIRDWNGE
jgi:hypothetical protein